jgi:HEPN domain-containing protein
MVGDRGGKGWPEKVSCDTFDMHFEYLRPLHNQGHVPAARVAPTRWVDDGPLPSPGSGDYYAAMAGRAADWLRQAQADLAHARRALEDGTYEWSCFAAQQSAEKAAKAAHQALGQEAWGHVITELLDALRPDVPGIDDELLDRARALDKLYIPTRYPNGLAGGAPTDFYTRAEAERAVADAEAVLELCGGVLSRP